MHDHRLDRGTTAVGIFFVLIGLIAFVWVANGADPAAFAAAAPYLLPLVLVGLGIVVIAAAVPSRAPAAATARRGRRPTTRSQPSASTSVSMVPSAPRSTSPSAPATFGSAERDRAISSTAPSSVAT